MTRPAGGKPRYRLHVEILDGWRPIWKVIKMRTKTGKLSGRGGPSSYSSAEAIRRAPR